VDATSTSYPAGAERAVDQDPHLVYVIHDENPSAT